MFKKQTQVIVVVKDNLNQLLKNLLTILMNINFLALQMKQNIFQKQFHLILILKILLIQLLKLKTKELKIIFQTIF